MSATEHLSPAQFFHGTPDIGGARAAGSYGVHVGTREAAKQALEARIGRRADGKDWDGTQEYGKTLLAAHGHGYGADAPKEPHYPTGKAAYSTGDPVPMHARPALLPVEIVGPMTNTPHTPHEDFKANGMMAGQLKRGRAKRGYYYENVGEDAGSISAVVPSWQHLRDLRS